MIVITPENASLLTTLSALAAQGRTYISLPPTMATLPLPKPLRKHDIIQKGVRLSEAHFRTDHGKDTVRILESHGYHVISWPDGTRCAIKVSKNRKANAKMAFIAYTTARKVMEKVVDNLANAEGGANG